MQELQDAGIVGRFFLPQTTAPSAAILVLGGSDGGDGYAASVGEQLAAQGYAVLALAYFQKGALPRALTELPLEYFDAALRWLESHPRVDPARLGVFGFSKGAEAALLLASRNKSLRAVVAAAPSQVAWEGLDRYVPTGRSSWAVDGSPLPYVAYDRTLKKTTPLAMYTRSLESARDQHDKHIAVEKINGPLLLLSGGRDKLWPSAHMAEQIMARLKQHEFPHAYQHVCYPDAGHAVVPLFRLRDRLMFRLFAGIFGGDAKSNKTARLDAWNRALAFFDYHFGNVQPTAQPPALTEPIPSTVLLTTFGLPK